jgi:hypothetical protein
MKNINNYINLAAYEADANRPTGQNTVSLIKDINIIKRNGVNIITEGRFAGVGDTVVYDTVDLRPKVVKLGTLTLPLPSRYIIVGTVWGRNEKNVFVVSNQYLPSAQWGAPWKVKLSGFSFASAGSFTLTINATQTAAISYTTSDTLTTLAASMQAAIRAVMTIATWTVTAYADYIVVEQNSYTPNVTSFTCSDASITVSILTGNYQTATSGLLNNNTSVFRIDGSVTSWAGANYEKFLAYYSVNGSDTTGGGLLDASVIRESRFNVTDNPVIFNYYGTYRNYIAAKMIRYPYSKGIITDNDGKGNTNKLAAVMFTDHDGTLKAAYPAASSVKNFDIAGAVGFTSGNWWLPTASELYLIMKDITYGLSGFSLDRVNKGIEAAGGTKINVGHYIWTSSEYAGIYAFYYNGGNGSISAFNKINVFNVRPLSAFQIL